MEHRYELIDVDPSGWANSLRLGFVNATSPRDALRRASFDAASFERRERGGSLYRTSDGLVLVRRFHRDGGV